MQIITVGSGDTVFSIAQNFGVSEEKIIEDNGLDESGELVVGQSLIILFPNEQVLAFAGQSVSQIAQENFLSQRQIFRNNIFLSGNEIIPNESIVVINYQSEPAISKFIGGYAYDFIDDTLLNTVVPYMTYLMPFTYGFRQDGSLIVPDDQRLIQAALDSGAIPLMHLSTLTEMGNFSNELSNFILNNIPERDTLISNVLENVLQKGYGGVDVDFEFLFAEDREVYVDFIRELTSVMNQNGKICVVAVPPKVSDSQTGLLYEGVDYAGLGEAADYVFLMTYEWGYRFGPPLAVAPIPSVRRVLDYAVSRIPREKIILGLSNYGYDWPLPYIQGETEAMSISTREALDIAKEYNAQIIYDENAMAPYFYYTNEEGIEHIVWYEDARSFEAKTNLLLEYDFAGAFIWDLMRENPQGYVTLNSLIDIQ